jgi:23S rRNA (cytidine1920-2'-O)/16S rRNA (cytidine1409-2'-O)-methyltransferase
MRKRADIVLVERGLFSSRARAQAAIEAGLVSVGGVALTKASEAVTLPRRGRAESAGSSPALAGRAIATGANRGGEER